ncbi:MULTISPECIES: NUDIX domain-containing protein [Acinetobacter]|uniref:8-oxo-dGTP diphosphatase n=1 Tax=Acinetobacter pittii TaxID=48296 RepID=A0AAE9S9P1_ACIPI|nr:MULTISPECIES: thiamine phosphate synthase [Acinetobacter calcoaceticus/baumannii complex]AZP28741.1 NUDIX domain-containing protein [Acinetobacter pittii]EXC29077.1 NUDIX domain protein [Acinetobacter sp. 809848]EXE28325.1 NUDIX domain protein [Acinetobacter sp. 907131]EXS18657.1 NUDIX domain protein [Acinetobacter sp. 883425]MBK0410167.1 thiamine phosphate synthase [Acinetobacter pittii]
MPKPIVDVAIAILIHRGKILVGWREEQQHQGGKHEFPGGKVEQGETPEEACRREIYEEVGIGLKDWHQFDYIHHEYDDIIVNLHLFHSYVPDELLNLIHQPWAWYTRDQLLHLNFPKANKNIIKRLYWPHLIKISNTLSTVESSDALLYWRIEEFEPQYIEQLTALDEGQRSSLIINVDIWRQLSPELQKQIKTVHLKQSQLMNLHKGDLRVGVRYIAACHDAVSLKQAQQIGCDAIFISPVKPTMTHPEAVALGWERFSDLAQNSQIPVFALGGVHPDDLATAQQHGAYGLAGIRNF